jgi:hypothetical protein
MAHAFTILPTLPDDDECAAKRKNLDKYCPNWRDLRYDNDAPMFADTGMMLDEKGNRSIFDDVDE